MNAYLMQFIALVFYSVNLIKLFLSLSLLSFYAIAFSVLWMSLELAELLIDFFLVVLETLWGFLLTTK